MLLELQHGSEIRAISSYYGRKSLGSFQSRQDHSRSKLYSISDGEVLFNLFWETQTIPQSPFLAITDSWLPTTNKSPSKSWSNQPFEAEQYRICHSAFSIHSGRATETGMLRGSHLDDRFFPPAFSTLIPKSRFYLHTLSGSASDPAGLSAWPVLHAKANSMFAFKRPHLKLQHKLKVQIPPQLELK